MSVRSYHRAYSVPGKRMNSPAMLQITNHCDGQPIYSANLFSDCENVQQCLSGMLTSAISCIDQRLAAVVCCSLQHKRSYTVQGLFQTIQYETTSVPLPSTHFNTKQLCLLPTQHTCVSCDSKSKEH
jgi:hypothetical protein